MRRSNFALRLQPSLTEEARRAAEAEGSTLRTEEYFQERARRANRAETLRILERAGKGNPPMEGDERVMEARPEDKSKRRKPARPAIRAQKRNRKRS